MTSKAQRVSETACLKALSAAYRDTAISSKAPPIWEETAKQGLVNLSGSTPLPPMLHLTIPQWENGQSALLMDTAFTTYLGTSRPGQGLPSCFNLEQLLNLPFTL